jgi:VWFA-related protein
MKPARPDRLPWRRLFFIVLALVGANGFLQKSSGQQAPAQESPAQETTSQETAPETTLRSRSNVVLIPALVKDRQGGIVYGLQVKDFLVEDDGVEQSIRLDDAPDGQPISLVIAIQTGRRANYEFPRIAHLNSMIEPLLDGAHAEVGVLEFDSEIHAVRDFTDDAQRIALDLQNLRSGDDGAAILDAVDSSVKLLEKTAPGQRRVLLLISETRDHGSHMKTEDVVAEIGKANVVMYALAFSPALSNVLDTARGNNNPDLHPEQTEMHKDINFLDLGYRIAQALRKNVPSTVASMTGGEYELFATHKKFEARMTDFTNHLGSRYLLSFAPKNPHPGLHQLTVRLRNDANNTVLARTSYWAEGSK